VKTKQLVTLYYRSANEQYYHFRVAEIYFLQLFIIFGTIFLIRFHTNHNNRKSDKIAKNVEKHKNRGLCTLRREENLVFIITIMMMHHLYAELM